MITRQWAEEERTSWNHFRASDGGPYCFVCSLSSSTSEGNTASNSFSVVGILRFD